MKKVWEYYNLGESCANRSACMPSGLFFGLLFSLLAVTLILVVPAKTAWSKPLAELEANEHIKQQIQGKQSKQHEIIGEVEGVGPSYLTLLKKGKKGEFDTEIRFDVHGDVLLKNLETIHDLNRGDTIRIVYDEVKWTREERDYMERSTKEIHYLSRAGSARVLTS